MHCECVCVFFSKFPRSPEAIFLLEIKKKNRLILNDMIDPQMIEDFIVWLEA